MQHIISDQATLNQREFQLMETESNIQHDASPMRMIAADKYSLAAKLDGIPNQCETVEAEDNQKGDKTTKITTTSIRTREDSESSTPEKASIEAFNELSYCQADKRVNQPLKQISENETENQTGITSKDIEIGGHKIEVINDTKVEEYDLDIENEEVSNLKVHEHEPFSDNIDISHDQHASSEVISDTTIVPKEKREADLQYIEEATIISEANLRLINENMELETKNLYKDDEQVTESGVKDEDLDNKYTSHSITQVEDENKETNLVYDNDNNREDKPVHAKTEDSPEASQDTQGLETTEINLSNDTEEQENVPALYTGEKSDIEDSPLIIQDEAKEIEPATEIQLQGTTTEGEPEQEALSTVPTLAIVEDGTIEKTIQEQTNTKEDSTTIDDNKSRTPENEQEQAAKVLEAIDPLKTTSKVHAENEEHADQKSEAQSSENMTLHINSEEMEKTESIQKSSYDNIEQEQSPQLPSAENQETNEGGKVIMEKAIDVPVVQTIQPPPTIESVIVETLDKSIHEEIIKDAESVVTDTEEGQTGANEFEDKINVLEEIEVIEVNRSTCEENEKNAEPQSDASLDTIALKHPDSQRLESTEKNLSNDTEEQENVLPSGTGEKSEIKGGPQIIQEEAKEIELATEKQLPVTAIESVPEEDTPSATARLALVQSGIVEKTIQELTHEEEEPTSIVDGKSCTQENQHDQAITVHEAINQLETMTKVSAESVEHADQKSEAQKSEGMITKHGDIERMVKMENIEKESHDVKEVEESPELHSTEHQEIYGGGKIIPEEVLGVPEDQTLQSLPVIASTRVESADKSIEEEVHKDIELAITATEEGPRAEIEFEEKTDVLEVIVDHKETENLQAPDITEKLEVKDCDEILQGEAKETEQGAKIQLLESGKECVPKQEAPSTVPTLAFVEDGTIEKTIQEQINKEEESTTIDDDKSCTPGNEHEQAARVLEAIDLLKTTSKVRAESEEHADQKYESQSSENMTNKHIDSDETNKTETSQKSSYDIKEQEQSSELPSAENWEINARGKITMEEAIGVPEVQTIQPPPTIESVIVETLDKSIHEEILKDAESEVTNTEEGQTGADEFEDKTNVQEAFELHEVNGSTCKENEKSVEPQSQASLNTIPLKHLDLQRLEGTKINLSNDTEEQENVPPTGTGEKSEIKDGPKIIQEEAKETEIATEKQLPVTAIESVPEEDAPSIMAVATLELVQSGTIEKTIQELPHEEEEATPIDDEKSCTKENEHDQATEVLEAISLPETMSKVSAESVEHADQKSEAQRSEGLITEHVDSEEMVKMENIEKESQDVKEVEKSPELPSAEHQEINSGGNIISEEVLGVPEDQTLQSLPVIASTEVESADKSIEEEVHKDVELEITDTEESPRAEIKFEEKTDVLEALDIHEVIARTSEEADRNTTILKQPDLEGLETKKINMINDTEGTEHLQAPYIGEKLEVKDGDEILHEEVKDTEHGTKKKFPEAGVESVLEQEALLTLPKLVAVEGGTAEKTIQEQTHEEDEPTPIDDDKSFTTENEHEKATKAIEAIDLPETMSTVSAENEDNADQKLKEQCSDGENLITSHSDLEEIVTMESTEKSIYDVKELKKTLELHSTENQDIDDGGKIMPEEAIGVPDGETLKSLLPLASIGVQNVDRSIEEEVHIDGESTMTDTEEVKTHENEVEDKTNNLEAFELHENEEKVEPRSAASLEIIVSKHTNLEGLENTAIKQSNDTEEQENIPESNTGEKLEIKDGPEIIQEEAREKELATEIQLPETVTESVHEQEAPPTVTLLETVESGMVEETIQEQIHEEDQPKLIDDERSHSSENEHEQASNVLEAIRSKGSAENEELANNKSEAQSGENVITMHINSEERGTIENIKKSSYVVPESYPLLEKTPELPSAENREITASEKFVQEEAIGVPEDQTLQPPVITESVVVQTVDKSIQEEIHKDGKSAVTDIEEGQRHENEFEGKTNVLEASDKKAEPQSEPSIDTVVLQHPDLEVLETTKINLSNETEEQENVLASDTGKKLEVKDAAQIIPDEAKEIELATENLLSESSTETIVEGVTVEKTSQEQTLEEEESKLIDDDKSCSPENEYEQATKVVEVINEPQTASKANAENEENANQKSEEQSRENVIAKHVDSEEMVTLENIDKSSYDVKETKMIPELLPAESQEINDCGKILLEEAVGVPQDQTLIPLLSIASDGVKTGDNSIQEIHTHGESTVMDTEEGQTHQNESEYKTKVLEAFDLLDENACTSKENREKGELQSDASPVNTVSKHWNLEGLETTELNPGIDTDEPKNVSAPDTGDDLEIKDYSHVIQEEAKETELATERDLLDAAKQSVSEQEARSTVSLLATAEGGKIEIITQEQAHEEKESTPLDDDKSCAQENENEQATGVLEAIDLSKTMRKARVENEEHDEHKAEAPSIVNMITKHIDLEEMMTKEKIKMSSYDVNDLERTEIPSSENEEINDGRTNMLEEATGVPEDQALQPLPTTESGIVETPDKSIEEKLQKDGEPNVTDTEEGVTHENESVENVLEELDSHEVIAITNKEIENKVESQSESILNTTALKHSSLEGQETIEINPGIETEEPENVPVSDTGKKIEMKDGAKIIQEEESVMELATENQLPEAPTESVNEQEDLSTRATPVIVEGGMLEKLTHQQTREEEESSPIDDNKSYTPENKHELESIVLEEIDLPKTTSIFSAENEECGDNKLEAQCSNVIAKHTDPEEMATTECIEKSTYDVKLLDKTQELPSSETREINAGEKIMPHETIDVPCNQSLQSPPTNIQKETHKDNESAVTETEEEHLQENEYEGKTNVLEAFDLLEVIASTSKENEEKSEPELEVSLYTIVLNKSIDTRKPENVSASNTGEKLEIKDGSEIIQDEAKEMELATDKMLPETTTKSVPEQEALSTITTRAIPEGGTVEKIIQGQANEEEESTLEDDHKGYTIKNEHENETKVVEVIGLPETKSKASAENEEHADQKSESESSVNIIAKHIDSEETITTDIPSVIHQEINVGGKITPKKAIGVPKDQTLQPLPSIAYVGVETIERSIQEEILKDDEPQPEASLNSNVIKNPDLEGLEKLEIKDGAEIILVEAKEMELATEIQLQESETESAILEDKAQTVLPTSEFVKGETIEKSFQEETLKEEQSTAIDKDNSFRPENEHEQTTEVLQPGECIRVGNFQAETQRETSIPGTNLVFLNQIEDVDLADARKVEDRENSTTPNEDFSSSTIIDASEGPQKDEGKNALHRSLSLIPQEVEKEDKAESFNRVDIKNIFEKKEARTNENIEEQIIDSDNSLVEVKISLPIEGIVNQVKDHNIESFKATDSIEQRDIMDLSFENDAASKEAAPRDSEKAIESEAIGKVEIQELETDQIGSAKGSEGDEEFEKISPLSNDNVMIKDSEDSDVKVSPKKHHGILSGVGSKVKHSISKVKKAITGKSSHSKTSSEK